VEIRRRRAGAGELDQAGYTPVVSDGRRLYLVGYFELVGLNPMRR
jgi:hypothetical protein